MPYYNEKLQQEVKDEARKLARQLAPARSSEVTDKDVTNVLRRWFCTSFVTEAKQNEYLARCARLGLPHLMDGWDVEKYCRSVGDIENELEMAVVAWDEDAADTGEKGSDIYYETKEVEAVEKWLQSNPFVFWLLGYVIEDASKRWVDDNALDIIETSNRLKASYVDANLGIREAIEEACDRFFRTYREVVS